MKTFLSALLVLLASYSISLSDTKNLQSLLNSDFVLGAVPAVETTIDQTDPWLGSKTYGMKFDLEKAFSLEPKTFKKLVASSIIDSWTLYMDAPWGPGKKTSWVLLDNTGAPFLSMTLVEGQENLIVFKQVIAYSKGKASLGMRSQFFFRCEVSSKQLASELESLLKKRSSHSFKPCEPGSK